MHSRFKAKDILLTHMLDFGKFGGKLFGRKVNFFLVFGLKEITKKKYREGN